MLDKPDIQDTDVIASLHDDYALPIQKIEFLPLGADRNTAVYCAKTSDGTAYFTKLRCDDFNDMSLLVPQMLCEQGVAHIIRPLATRDGRIWTQVGEFFLSVYPFIVGRDAYEVGMTDAHWIEFGRTLKAIHTAALPLKIEARIPKETFSGQWRERVRQFQKKIAETTFMDPVSVALVNLMKKEHGVIDTLVRRAHLLGEVLQGNPSPFVLCHADIHAWNVLIQSDNTFYVVDWDTIMLAPKERDLMFVASGLFGDARTPEQEVELFYHGYGDVTQVDPVALAYYRYERIVQDIADYCDRIFLTKPGGENRAQGLRQLSSQFEPGQVIDIAFRSEQFLPSEFREL